MKKDNKNIKRAPKKYTVSRGGTTRIQTAAGWMKAKLAELGLLKKAK